MNILALVTVLALSHHHNDDKEIVVIPESQSNLPTLSWIGDVKQCGELFSIKVERDGDEIFIDSFEPEIIGDWGVKYYTEDDVGYIGDLTCGLWTEADFIVINCNQPE